MQNYSFLFKTLRPSVFQNLESMSTKGNIVYILYIMQYLQQRLGQQSKIKYIVLVSYCLNISTLTKHSQTQRLTKAIVCFSYLQICGSEGMTTSGCPVIWAQPGLAVSFPDCSLERLFSHYSHSFFSLFLDQQFPGAGFLMSNHRNKGHRDKPNSNPTSDLEPLPCSHHLQSCSQSKSYG